MIVIWLCCRLLPARNDIILVWIIIEKYFIFHWSSHGSIFVPEHETRQLWMCSQCNGQYGIINPTSNIIIWSWEHFQHKTGSNSTKHHQAQVWTKLIQIEWEWEEDEREWCFAEFVCSSCVGQAWFLCQSGGECLVVDGYEISPHLPVTFITALILTLSNLINCYTSNIIEFKQTKTLLRAAVTVFQLCIWISSNIVDCISSWRFIVSCMINSRSEDWICINNAKVLWINTFPAFSRTSSRNDFHGHEQQDKR